MSTVIAKFFIEQQEFLLDQFDGIEKFSAVWQFNLSLKIPATHDFSGWLLKSCDLIIIDNPNQPKKYVGIVNEINTKNFLIDEYCWQVTISLLPRLHLLNLNQQARPWLNQTLSQLTQQLAYQHQLTIICEFESQKKYCRLQLPHESDYQFLLRQLAKEKLFFTVNPRGEVIISQKITSDNAQPKNPLDDSLVLISEMRQGENESFIKAKTSATNYELRKHIEFNRRPYFVYQCQHSFNRFNGYVCILTCSPQTQSPLYLNVQSITYPVYGRIEATTQTLNALGQYAVIFSFDQTNTAVTLFRCQPFLSQAVGFHSPLAKGDEVLIHFVDDDADNPIILGSLAHASCGNLVSSDNKHQAIWQSKNRNAFIFDQQSIQINCALQNYLAITPDEISLTPRQGVVQLKSNHKIELTTQQAIEHQTQKQHHVHFKQHFLSQSQQHYSQSNSIQMNAQDCFIEAAQCFQLSTKNNIEIKISGDAQFQGDSQIEAHHFNLIAKQKIIFRAGDFVGLSHGDNQIEINPQQIKIKSQQIHWQAQQFELLGQCIINQQSYSSTQQSKQQNAVTPEPVPSLSLKNSQVKLENWNAQIQFYPINTTLAVTISDGYHRIRKIKAKDESMICFDKDLFADELLITTEVLDD